MVNKCVAYGCKTGYISSLEDKKVASFNFLLKNQQLLNYWVHFVNRSDWKHSPEGFQFKKHFNCVVYYNLIFNFRAKRHFWFSYYFSKMLDCFKF